MTLARTALAASALALAALASGNAAAGHLRDRPEAVAAAGLSVPVDAMPPGQRAAYIVGIREELAAHGYDPGPPASAVTFRMAAAIRAYQRDAGLPADGVASRELLDHLKFALPKVYAAGVWPGPGAPYPQSSGPAAPPAWPGLEGDGWPDEVTSEPLPDLPEPPSDQATAVPPPAEAEAYRPRTLGGVVSLVQSELRDRGYYEGPVDGKFTPETSAAVRRFQEDNGLPVDGVINTALLNALEAEPPAPRSAAPTPLEGGNGDSGKL